MALSGWLATNDYDGRYYRVDWSATQDIESNTSTVYWELNAYGGNSGWYAERTLKLWVGGLVYEKYDRVERYKGKIASGYVTINHDEEGNASLYLGIDAAVRNSTINCTGEYTYWLDTIARCSQPSCVTWPDTTRNVGDIGSTITVHMNRKSDTFLHYCYCHWGGRRFEIGGNIADNVDWTLPMDMCNDIPANNVGTGTIYCDTYNADYVCIGTKTVEFDANVPSSVQPTVSCNYADDTKLKDKYGGYVQNNSKLKVIVAANGVYGSAIKSYETSFDGNSAYEDVGILDMPSSGTIPVNTVVTDSRDRQASYSADIEVIPYFAPMIKSIKAYRVDGTGAPNSSGNNFKVDFTCSVAPVNNKNSATYKIRYKKKSDKSYQEVILKEHNNQYEVTGSYTLPASNVSYDIQLEVTDDFNTTVKNQVGTATKKHQSWLKNRGLALGKVAEFLDTFEVDWDTRLNKKVYVQNQPLADFVIEQGKKDGWDYVKYSSGRCELYRKGTIDTAFTEQWGSMYCGGHTPSWNYPWPFKETPVEVCTMTGDSLAVITFVESWGYNNAEKSGYYGVCRPTTTADSHVITYNIYTYGYLQEPTKAGGTDNNGHI